MNLFSGVSAGEKSSGEMMESSSVKVLLLLLLLLFLLLGTGSTSTVSSSGMSLLSESTKPEMTTDWAEDSSMRVPTGIKKGKKKND